MNSVKVCPVGCYEHHCCKDLHKGTVHFLYMMKLENKEAAYYRLNKTNLSNDLKKKLIQKISKTMRHVENGLYFCRNLWIDESCDLQAFLCLGDEQASDLIK